MIAGLMATNGLSGIFGVENGVQFEISEMHTKADGLVWSAVDPTPEPLTRPVIAQLPSAFAMTLVPGTWSNGGVPDTDYEKIRNGLATGVIVSPPQFNLENADRAQQITVEEICPGAEDSQLSLPVRAAGVPTPPVYGTDWSAALAPGQETTHIAITILRDLQSLANGTVVTSLSIQAEVNDVSGNSVPSTVGPAPGTYLVRPAGSPTMAPGTKVSANARSVSASGNSGFNNGPDMFVP